MSFVRNYEPVSQLVAGLTVKATDEYPATDITDLTQAPSGSLKRYTIAQLQAFIGSGGISWNNITGVSATMQPNSGYVANNASTRVVLTLPAAIAFGQIIYIAGFGAAGWQVQNQAGQQINIGSSPDTLGASGFIASTNQFDSVLLLCVVTNTNFIALGGPQGNLTIN